MPFRVPDTNVPALSLRNVTKEITERQRIVLELIRENKSLTIPEMFQETNMTGRTVKRDIANLQELGIISREDGRKDGAWIMKQDEG